MTERRGAATSILNEAVRLLRYEVHGSADPLEMIHTYYAVLLPNRVRILDVGGGTGSLVASGKHNDVLGVEPDKLRAEVAASYG